MEMVEVSNQTNTKLKKPNKYAVIILNDNYTPIDFVIEVLMKFFNKSLEEANEIAKTAHEKGSAIVEYYPKEIAITKSENVNYYASQHKHPLKTIVKPM
jgi:ATP-dependent Clp protease adaptor protein ClpS